MVLPSRFAAAIAASVPSRNRSFGSFGTPACATNLPSFFAAVTIQLTSQSSALSMGARILSITPMTLSATLPRPAKPARKLMASDSRPASVFSTRVGRRADRAAGDGDDRVDEAGDDLDDLRDLVHEHHDGVVDRQDRRDEAGAGNEHGDQLRDRLLHHHVDDEVGDAADDHVLEVGELLLDLVPRRRRAVADQRHDDVEAGLHRLDDGLARSPSRASARMFGPGEARAPRTTNLAISTSENAFGM